MRCSVALAIIIALDASEAHAQYAKHNVTLGMGAALPRGELTPFFADSFVLNAGYGYRFHRYFQADVGFDTVFQAGRVRDFLETGFGPLRIRDYQFFIPVGGRVIAPLLDDRLQVYGGGGFAYMRYTELLRQPAPDFRIDCPVCSSRHGVGYYATAGVNYALDRGKHFRVGAGTKVYRGSTDGDPFAGIPALETDDRWLNIFGQLTFSF